MSAFYSNQPDSSLVSNNLAANGSVTEDQVESHQIFDEETAMFFPRTDESGEPIELNAPPNEDDPTPEEIELRSEFIRRRWSDRVKKKRHLRAPVKWDVPSVPVADIDFH